MSPNHLRPFTRDDWNAFAGCEAATPWVFYDDARDRVVVVDGRFVEVTVGDQACYSAEFPTEAAALLLGDAVAGGAPVSLLPRAW